MSALGSTVKNVTKETIGVAALTWVIMGIALLPAPVIAITQFYKHRATPVELLFLVIPFLGIYIHACSLRIRLSRDGLEYLSAIFPTKKILWEDIRAVKTGFKISSFEGPYFLEVFGDSRSLKINIKPFRKKDLVRLAQLLKRNAPSAKFDRATERLAGGKLPSMLDA